MFVYALSSPFSGYTVDLLSRRLLIAAGLAFWSLICAATALSRSFVQLVLFRAAEGLGESFYFPASMSVLADYHGPRTRSRAMSIHQTSVYLGTAGGAVLAGYLGEHYGWRSPFWSLGLAGLVYAGLLAYVPGRAGPRAGAGGKDANDRPAPTSTTSDCPDRSTPATLADKVARIVTQSRGGVAPGRVRRGELRRGDVPGLAAVSSSSEFDLGLADSSLTSTFWPLASLPGRVAGRRGGRLVGAAVGGRPDP